jgi:hypothetical protein
MLGHRAGQDALICCDRKGCTPLHDAAASQSLGAVKLMLQYPSGRDVATMRDNTGHKPADLSRGPSAESSRQLLSPGVCQ